MSENKIRLFIENSVKGYENRKKLFDEISKELYEVLYANVQEVHLIYRLQ